MYDVLVDLPSEYEARAIIDDPRYCVGSGVDRTVYRIPGSRWVYKYDENKDSWANQREWKNYNRHKDNMPEGIKLPEMHWISHRILAAEFIDNEVDDIADSDSECEFFGHDDDCNEKECWITPWLTRLESVYDWFTDIHGGNVRIFKNDIYIIDLGA